MSSDGGIGLIWGDGEQTFRLGIGQFRELQEKVNLRRMAIGAPSIGPMALFNALRANDAWPDDIRDVLRLGLVGGGKTPAEAHRLLTHYFDDFDAHPPLENMRPAFVVLMAGLAGPPGEDVKKKPREATSTPTSTPRSTLPPSTDPARP